MVLEASAGTMPALADDPAIGSLAALLGEPLSAAFLTWPVAMESDFARVVQYDKPEGWDTIHNWEVLALDYGVADGMGWWKFSLFYSDQEAAADDAQELVQRMQGYQTTIPLMYPEMSREALQGFPQQPIDFACNSLSSSVEQNQAGSTLTVHCALSEDVTVSFLWQMIEMRDLGFLLP
jgi:hypothetical protein